MVELKYHLYTLLVTEDALPTTSITPIPVTSSPATLLADSTTALGSTDETTTQVFVRISISITAGGANTAGETYSLECSAAVTGSSDHPSITWLDPMNNLVSSEMIYTTGSSSTLTFNPLSASHAGMYTCSVNAGGVTKTQTLFLTVNGT